MATGWRPASIPHSGKYSRGSNGRAALCGLEESVKKKSGDASRTEAEGHCAVLGGVSFRAFWRRELTTPYRTVDRFDKKKKYYRVSATRAAFVLGFCSVP
jgi:hypothetical protein